MDRQASISHLERMLSGESEEPKALPLSVLKDITNGFSDDYEIGRGGFAVVYKGIFGNRMIAVKRLSNTYMHENEFQREVQCLMRVKHKNIVRFLGYCADTQGNMVEIQSGNFVLADVQHRLLCFEYLPGSLDDYTDASHGLDWRRRYEIIKGITEGLHYLHQNHIAHLDLKPANVLLDKNLVPKISDFGLSRCFNENQIHASISRVVGTLGYLAPESHGRKITMKSDIYSLGVIFNELLTGERGYTEVKNLLENWRNRLEKSEEEEQLKQLQVCAEIARECTKFNPAKRPDARNIIDRLEEMETTYVSFATCVSRSSSVPPQVLESFNVCGLENSTEDIQLEQVRGCTEVGKERINCSPEMTPDVGYTADRLDDMESTEESTETNASRSQRIFMARELERILLDGAAEPVELAFSLLEDITNSFSHLEEIGQDGFAVFYKGVLRGGNVTVKQLSEPHMHQKRFNGELECSMKLKHKNVVRFLGYCVEIRGVPGEFNGRFVIADVIQNLLCFEYLPKGSLDRYISDASCGLEWRERYNIIREICDGLNYLHRNHVVHADFKPENILLDDNMTPKITGFFFSRVFKENESHISVSRSWGTWGYMPPEFNGTKITYKYDLYGLGVVIMELLTGKRAYKEIENVLEHWSVRFSEKSQGDEQALEQIRICTEIALECMKYDPEKRPAIQDIVHRLNELEGKETTTGQEEQKLVDHNSDHSDTLAHGIWIRFVAFFFCLQCK